MEANAQVLQRDTQIVDHTRLLTHHIWVIARINEKYRALAVVDTVEIPGADLPRTCCRLLNIFQSIANRGLIETDIQAAKEKDDDWWDTQLTRHSDLA